VSDPLDDLTEVLSAQAAELRTLVPLLDAQETALTGADPARVTAVMQEQEPILRRLLRLDTRRRTLATTLATRAGLDPARVSLSALLARSDVSPAALPTLQRELRELLHTVDVRSRRNAFLLHRAVAYIDGLVRVMMGATGEPAPVYAATGQPAARRAEPRLLDRSA